MKARMEVWSKNNIEYMKTLTPEELFQEFMDWIMFPLMRLDRIEYEENSIYIVDRGNVIMGTNTVMDATVIFQCD